PTSTLFPYTTLFRSDQIGIVRWPALHRNASSTPSAASWFLATSRPPGVFRRLMEGTDRVFERLVRDHQHRIYALGLALTGNRHRSEEHTSELQSPCN